MEQMHLILGVLDLLIYPLSILLHSVSPTLSISISMPPGQRIASPMPPLPPLLEAPGEECLEKGDLLGLVGSLGGLGGLCRRRGRMDPTTG